MKPKVSTKEIKKALEETGGMPTHAAKSLGISYTRLYQIIKANPELVLIKEVARAKLHEELESLSVFAIKTGYIQKSKLDQNGKPTSETEYEEVDVKTRLDKATQLMGMYKASVGIKDEIDITTKGKEIKSKGITIIELPSHLRPREE